MHRRSALILGAGALLQPAAVRSRAQGRPLIGVLHSGDPAVENWNYEYLERGLRSAGWTLGRDYVIEVRSGYSDPERIATAARELVDLQPDLLFTGSNVSVVPLQRLTRTIPIVGAFLHDPVGSGLAASLAHPRGNVTGVESVPGAGLNAKRMQILAECVPTARRMAALWAASDSAPTYADELLGAARALDVTLNIVEVRTKDDFPRAFEKVLSQRPDGMVLVGVGTIVQQTAAICAFAARNRLPAIYGIRQFPLAGLLMSFGNDIGENFRRAVVQAEKILRGAKPGDLSIEHPTRFELAINVRAAQSMGVKIPPSLLQRADLVIE